MVEVKTIEQPRPQEIQKPEVWIHTANFLPWSAVVSNSTLLDWVEKTKADKLEWMAASPLAAAPGIRHIPIGPVNEVLATPVAVLRQLYGEKLGAGHVIFNPYSNLWNLARRAKDPLREDIGERMALYNLIIAEEEVSRTALEKLDAVKEGKLPIVVYPPFNGKDVYGKYNNARIQTHPAFFNDNRDAKGLIEVVKKGDYSQVCVDTYHFQEATNTGFRPFGETEKDLFKSLEELMKAGVLGEVHIQPGRLINLDTSVDSEADLRAALSDNPSYDTFTGRLLQFMIHDLGFMGPYTSEIDPKALAKIHGKSILLPHNMDKMLNEQASVVDYIRRA